MSTVPSRAKPGRYTEHVGLQLSSGFVANGAVLSIDRPGDREFYYKTAIDSLAPGATVQWWWWFGTQPTLITIVPIPETPNVPLQCSQPMVQRNDDDTVIYFVDVTNMGSQPAGYHLSAKLTR
jgi:hypothetical protein